MRLAVISHTEHYKSADGSVVGWGPTVSELNHLASHFDEIIHLAVLHKESPPPSALPYSAKNIRFVPIPKQGGKSIWNKLGIVFKIPKTIAIISKVLKEVDVFQLRVPTGMGVYLIPYFTLLVRKKGWFKYAGNWNQSNPPMGYALQRWFLKNQYRTVTINGTWNTQPKHCMTFENPCLTAEERSIGKKLLTEKSYVAPFNFLFVGRLEDEKGVQRILDAFAESAKNGWYEKIHFVGDGPNRFFYEEFAKENDLKVQFHGFLDRQAVFNLYKKCSFLLLPSSASEGFPKVIAEAMNFGCVPIVSNISSIGQYVHEENGYILSSPTKEEVLKVLAALGQSSPQSILDKAKNGHEAISRFTFEFYNRRIVQEIIKQP